MRVRILFLIAPLALVLVVAFVVGTRFANRPEPSGSPGGTLAIRGEPVTSPVEALNDCIQERFRTLTSFGMARMPVVPQHLDRFDPGTPEEKAAVENLRLQGWSVGMYLGGLGLLEPPMSEAEWREAGRYDLRKAISKPIVIAGETTPAGLPEPWELQEIGRKALVTSRAGDKYEGALGRWSVDVRPVRANQVACLNCHESGGVAGHASRGTGQTTALSVGDALGVAVYVYARAPG